MAKYDYITRQDRYSKDKSEVEVAMIGNMPDQFKSNSRLFWQMVDEHERNNARLFREVVFGLPKELSQEQNLVLAKSFIKKLVHDDMLPWTMAIHKGKGNNPHVHLMFSERQLDGIERSDPAGYFRRANKRNPEKGGLAKVDTTKKQWLESTRKLWADLQNEHLAKAGLDKRVDHRSFKDQQAAAEAALAKAVRNNDRAAFIQAGNQMILTAGQPTRKVGHKSKKTVGLIRPEVMDRNERVRENEAYNKSVKATRRRYWEPVRNNLERLLRRYWPEQEEPPKPAPKREEKPDLLEIYKGKIADDGEWSISAIMSLSLAQRKVVEAEQKAFQKRMDEEGIQWRGKVVSSRRTKGLEL